MTILLVDGSNFCHRARAGFNSGELSVVYNFFRSFRSLVGDFKPSRVYFCLEGKPQARLEMLPEYKANRVIEVDQNDPKSIARAEEMRSFYRQKSIIEKILIERFPLSVVRHPRYECDDTIANIVMNSSASVDFVIVSNDTDFIQLLQVKERPNVRIFNPMKKEFVSAPDYPYVVWKSLRGDPTDNIPGIPGIGDKKAAALASDDTKLAAFLTDENNRTQYERNTSLISFARWSDDEAMDMTCSSPTRDWDDVKAKFDEFKFQSITNDKSWGKFVNTFDPLFGG